MNAGLFMVQAVCTSCQGSGYRADPCRSCGGKGSVSHEATLNIKVPQGKFIFGANPNASLVTSKKAWFPFLHSLY